MDTARREGLLTLAIRHLDALYTFDTRGRMLGCRQPGARNAPRFHLVRTQLGNTWRMRADLPHATVAALSRLAGKEAPLPGAGEPLPPERIAAFRETLERDAPVEQEHRGPAFVFPDALPTLEGEAARPIDAVDAEAAGLGEELAGCEPLLAAWEGVEPVALCCTARGAPDDVVEAGVATLAGFAGRGHATRAVAAWALAVRAQGGLPLYSTQWGNAAARGVARKLGLLFYGEDLNLT